MRTGTEIPAIPDTASFSEAILEMSDKRMGMTAVLDASNHVIGIFTDGDLRRALAKASDVMHAPIANVMTRDPRTIGPDHLAVEAVELMELHKVHGLLVVAREGELVGALNIHDLLRAKVV
jgi:arabinose-5-phosphate isomerase